MLGVVCSDCSRVTTPSEMRTTRANRRHYSCDQWTCCSNGIPPLEQILCAVVSNAIGSKSSMQKMVIEAMDLLACLP